MLIRYENYAQSRLIVNHLAPPRSVSIDTLRNTITSLTYLTNHKHEKPVLTLNKYVYRRHVNVQSEADAIY